MYWGFLFTTDKTLPIYSPIKPIKKSCIPEKNKIIITIEVYPIGIEGSFNFSNIAITAKKNDRIAIIAPEKAIRCNGLVLKLKRKLLNSLNNLIKS